MKPYFSALLGFSVLILTAPAQDKTQPSVKSQRRLPKYQLTIRGAWKNASNHTVRRVLISAADELLQYFPRRTFKPMIVEYRAKGPPQLFYEGGLPPNHKRDVIKLTSQSTYWAQYIYQFSHELCHILHNAELKYPREVGWFAESLSELASLFVLRAQAKTWQRRPPFPGWAYFGKHLHAYADDIIQKRRLPAGKTLSVWYREHAEELRRNPVNRPLNAVVASALLPLFEEKPERWESLTWMSRKRPSLKNRSLSFPEFLAEWHFHCPAKHKPFIRRLAKEFGLTLPEIRVK